MAVGINDQMPEGNHLIFKKIDIHTANDVQNPPMQRSIKVRRCDNTLTEPQVDSPVNIVRTVLPVRISVCPHMYTTL